MIERPALLEFLRRFRNPLVLTLIVAGAVSAFLGDPTSAGIVGLVVALSVTLDFVQEHRAGRAAAALARTVSLRARVVRDGQPVTIPARDLVPGDAVLLSAGDLVPADARLLEARDLFVNQALLTGESFPVEKRPGEVSGPPVAFTAADNAVFAGSSIVSGSATALVCLTGPDSAVGEISRTLQVRPPADEFELGTRQFGLLIMRLTMLLVLFVLAVNLHAHRPVFESFLFAVALAVGLTPELLPMIVSVTLARGALRMGREQVIVKRLTAIHALGAMDVLCTDKTGTLTEAKIRLEKHVDVAGRDSERVLRLAWLNSHFETGLRSPLDEAILAHEELQPGTWTKVDEVPFDFERRRVSVLVDDGQERLLIVKGAPADMLALCRDSEAVGQPLDAQGRARIGAQVDAFEREGFRVLGIAWRATPRTLSHARVDDETQLVFAGLAAFLDPPKASARPALEALAAGGIEVKVVTGDGELVARHVCGALGLAVKGVLAGPQLEALDEGALLQRVEETTVFCRVTPSQKSRVIRALRRRRHVVGYLGDGINDAPSLHAADVGISVDDAVDVAREAADIILLQHDLGVLQQGVVQGRRTFANISKYLLMGTSSNFGNMASMAGASLFLPFLPMRPVQVLLNNLLYDLSELPIPLDEVDPDDVASPRRWDLGLIERFMVVAGAVSSLFDFLTFYLLLHVFHASEQAFQTGWFIESMATQVLVIFVIRTRGRAWKSHPHPVLAATALACVLVAAALPYSPLGPLFGFVAPPVAWLVTVAGLVTAYLLLAEAVKEAFFRRWRRRSSAGATAAGRG